MDRFVVGTGRCGSTLLSRMLAQHEPLLSVFEFFNGLDIARRFAGTSLSGAALADLISAEQPFVTAVLRRGYRVEEITYPFESEGARHSPVEPLPWILVSMLPPLADDPDRLFDEVVAWARAQPPRPPAAQYRALFAWLAAHLGKTTWVERSGSSIDYLPDLAAHFPEARFLHIHRDGREVALSMRRHHAYRLPIAFLYDVRLDSGRRVSELGAFDVHAPPTGGDVVTQILRSRPPPADFGRYWSDQICRGSDAMKGLPRERLHAIRFEDLVERPRELLAEVADFFELEGGSWIERAAGLVRGRPPLRGPELTPADSAALDDACRPGMKRVGRACGSQ